MAARPLSFWIKPALAAGLAIAANLLLYGHEIGWNLGLVALAFVAAVATGRPAVLRSRLGLPALIVSALFAASLIERPGLLSVLFFWSALVVAALAPRASDQADVLGWARRLIWAGLRGAIAAPADGRTLLAVRARMPRRGAGQSAAALVLPVVGGFVFFGLFVVANPVLSQALGGLTLPQIEIGRLLLTGFIGVAAWAVLRARSVRGLPAKAQKGSVPLPGVTPASIAWSLGVFNALFALQNGLDLAFLWSGAPLPEGVTLAEYAHRGAYPLIATALLAGLFVLVFLSPASEAARSRLVRRLVVLWVVQNLFLVASTALRTIDYIQAFSLTSLRIAALVWMALVALGLALICWRLLTGKSGSWLINANALAAGLVLAVSALADYDAVAAAWNVRHAREVNGQGAEMDLCLLSRMGSPALVSVAELARDARDPELRVRAAYVRNSIAARMTREGWRDWTWRDARRLARARQIAASSPPADLGAVRRDCSGRPRPAERLLTPPAQAGT